MSKSKGPKPREWLQGIHSVFDSIEEQAAAVASGISDCEDELHARLLRTEWSRFVGRLTEMAVAVSDMLERTVSRKRTCGQAPGAAKREGRAGQADEEKV